MSSQQYTNRADHSEDETVPEKNRTLWQVSHLLRSSPNETCTGQIKVSSRESLCVDPSANESQWLSQ
ncbi:hypothetical protein HHI36_006994, partial [Cryptolaemus montrouzieri]